MLRFAVAFGALSLFACNGCNDAKSPSAPASGPPTASADSSLSAATGADGGETLVHVDDDAKSFDVAKGATIAFKLASNAGTGYVWTPTQVDASVLAQQGDRSSEVSSDTPGAPKLDVYRFVAGAAGSTVVEMYLKRPFGSAPAARAIHVTVNVH